MGKTVADMEQIAGRLVRLAGCPHRLAADAVQEFLLGALEVINSDGFDAERDGALCYVTESGLNAARIYLARERNAEDMASLDAEGLTDPLRNALAGKTPEPLDIMAARETAAILVAVFTQASATLKPRDREIVRAFFFDGQSQAAIARDHHISRQRIHRIMSRFAERLRKIFTLSDYVSANDETPKAG